MNPKKEGDFVGEFTQLQRREVIHRLEVGDFSHDPLEFLDSLLLSHHLGMLTIYSVEELSYMYTCKVKGFNIGFALKPVGEHNEIVGIHNNEFDLHDLGHHIVTAAIRAGGNALDHFGSAKLNQLYEEVGFVEVSRVPYDPSYDPSGSFRAKYGELPVIYRVLPT